MLMLLVAFVGVVPIYGCIGFLDVFKKVGFGGLTTPGEMYALAIYFGECFLIYQLHYLLICCIGFMYGAFQGYARAFYAELIPLGEEARWYALFSITDKVRFLFSLQYITTAILILIIVQLISWSASGGTDHIRNGKYPLIIFFPCRYGVGCDAGVVVG